jgi:hypothetical protein
MTAAVVEHFNMHTKTRKDLYGFIDILAMSPGEGFLGIQSTSTGNMGSRVAKILAEPMARTFLESGGKIIVQGFKKYKKPVERKYWRSTERPITLADFSDGENL